MYAQQEQQVRLTAQNILLHNLRIVPQRRRWWGTYIAARSPVLVRHQVESHRGTSPCGRVSPITPTSHTPNSPAKPTSRTLSSPARPTSRALSSSTGSISGGANFWNAQFTGGTDFGGARVAPTAKPGEWPPSWFTRSAQPENGKDPAFLYLARVEEPPTPDPVRMPSELETPPLMRPIGPVALV